MLNIYFILQQDLIGWNIDVHLADPSNKNEAGGLFQIYNDNAKGQFSVDPHRTRDQEMRPNLPSCHPRIFFFPYKQSDIKITWIPVAKPQFLWRVCFNSCPCPKTHIIIIHFLWISVTKDNSGFDSLGFEIILKWIYFLFKMICYLLDKCCVSGIQWIGKRSFLLTVQRKNNHLRSQWKLGGFVWTHDAELRIQLGALKLSEIHADTAVMWSF